MSELKKNEEEIVKEENGIQDESEMKKKKVRKKFIIADSVLIGLMAAGYFGTTYYYKDKFLPDTWINNVDVSGLTVDEVENAIFSQIGTYSITVGERGKDAEEITASDIDYHYVSKGEVQQIKGMQSPFTWPVSLFQQTKATFKSSTTYDEEKFKEKLQSMNLVQDMVAPENAYVAFQDTNYTVVPEIEGDEVDMDKTSDVIQSAIKESKLAINVETEDCYKQPAQRVDDESLNNMVTTLNQYADTRIQYDFGSEHQEVLDGTTIKDWLYYNPDGSGEVSFDESAVSDYVANLAAQYDTSGNSRTITSWNGTEVTIDGGDYGWTIDQEAETNDVIALIKGGTQITRTPDYSKTANSRENQDIGDSYVEVDLTNQTVVLHVDGQVVMTTNCVSGTYTDPERMSDEGCYAIYYKESPATLRGEEVADGVYSYTSEVDFWMPYNGGEGLHNAPWRGSFGGDTYLYSGSHGCINLSYDAAQTIYDYVYTGFPVLVYYR